jgi:beta-glucosidase-like glycosyl hydrolase
MSGRFQHTRGLFHRLLLGLIVLAAIGGLGLKIFWHEPALLPAKRWGKKTIRDLAFRPAYEVPNSRVPGPDAKVEKPALENIRTTARERIAELIVGRFKDATYAPIGGLESSPAVARSWAPFGRYRPYNPTVAFEWASQVLSSAAAARKRTLLYDEGEGGYVLRIGSMPSAGDIGAYYQHGIVGETLRGIVSSPDRSVRARQVDSVFADHARVLSGAGIDVVLSPVLDVPTSPSINNYVGKDERTFSSDYQEVLDLAQRYVVAMHAQGIRCIAKHYPNIGALGENNLHATYMLHPENRQSEQETLNLYRALREDLDGVMLAHSGNARDRGRPFSMSPQAVRVLRDSVRFDGLITTDAVDMTAVRQYVREAVLSPRERALVGDAGSPIAVAAFLAFDAGVTTVLLGQYGTRDLEEVLDVLVRAYERDAVFREKIEEAHRVYGRFAR